MVVQVHFVDYGNTEVVLVKDLLDFGAELRSLDFHLRPGMCCVKYNTLPGHHLHSLYLFISIVHIHVVTWLLINSHSLCRASARVPPCGAAAISTE